MQSYTFAMRRDSSKCADDALQVRERKVSGRAGNQPVAEGETVMRNVSGMTYISAGN